MHDDTGNTPAGAIALVGMAGRFPGARDVDELWQLLSEGREATVWLDEAALERAGVPEAVRNHQGYVPATLPLPDMEMFDAGFFGLSPSDAAIMDPQHRHFLECCWAAIEDTGHLPADVEGSVGVFGGCGPQHYFTLHLAPNAELMQRVGTFLVRHTGNDKDFLTTRVSYHLDLNGPSLGVQTACSTSLVAVHTACQSLLSGECDMALAGAASIELPHGVGYIAADGEILSPTGHCCAFDDDAAGTLFGSGAAVVALRRLEDALSDGDRIYAVIRGTAVGNDGSGKAGYLAPSIDGQARVAAEALAVAGIEPGSVDYIEAHGTGTAIGDPIELTALAQAYGMGRGPGTIGIGSIKTNIGHLDTAAGVASLIKVALSLRHGEIPASLNFKAPNTRFDFTQGPFEVVSRKRPWPSQRDGSASDNARTRPRRAAVNSLGVGGTNAHLVLEEPPAAGKTAPHLPQPNQLLTLSAKTPEALDALAARWRRFATDQPDLCLRDAAYTTQVGRQAFAHRLGIVADSASAIVDALDRRSLNRLASARLPVASRPPEVVFMFPGGGAQYPGCGRGLYATMPVFRQAVDECLTHLPAGSAALADVLFGKAVGDPDAAERLERPSNSLLSVFILDYAYARLWQGLGVTPSAVLGSSAGDYAAAVLAGVMDVATAIRIITLRGMIFESMPPGAMLSVHLPERSLRALAGSELDIAVLGGTELGLVSGRAEAIDRFSKRLSEADIAYSRVRIGVAAHSRLLDEHLPAFREAVSQAALSPAQIPFISSLSGAFANPEELATPEFWVRHLRETVRFADGVATVLSGTDKLLLEVGPGRGLSQLVGLSKGHYEPRAVISSSPAPDDGGCDHAQALLAAGQLWANGVDVDLSALRGHGRPSRISVPTYPFARTRHWIDRPGGHDAIPGCAAVKSSGEADAHMPGTFAGPLTRSPGLERLEDRDAWYSSRVFRQSERVPTGDKEIFKESNWLVLTDGSDLADRLVRQIRNDGGSVTLAAMKHTALPTQRPVHRDREDCAVSWLDPTDEPGLEAFIAGLESQGRLPDAILQIWPDAAARETTAPEFAAGEARTSEPANRQEHGPEPEGHAAFAVLFGLLGAIQRCDWQQPLKLAVITRNAMSVEGEAVRNATAGLATGALKVWPREYPGGASLLIDLDASSERSASLPRRLLGEIGSAGAGGRNLAYRDARRFAEFLRPRTGSTEAATAGTGSGVSSPRLKREGCYVITGGTGGLGLLLARHLATRLDARVALLSRSAGNARIPADLTGNVTAFAADVTDMNALRQALARVRSRFGRVDGVIHAAGQLSDAPIGTKSLDEAMTVIAPKVVGAQNLSALCPEGSLDLFAVFSSTSALNGPPGQIDYAAANAFLEAFAATRSDGICLTWGPWFETGMTARLASGHSGHRSHAPHDEAGPGIPDAAPGTPVAPGTPLLGSPVPGQNDRERTYARWLDPGEEWSLAEHRMGDTFVLPGTAFIETARSAALSCDLELPLVLEELHFLTPVAMPPGTSRRLITRVETVGAGKAAKLARRLGFARGERRIEITQAGEDGEEVIAFTCRAHTATTAQSPISVTMPPTSAVPMIATPFAQTAGIDFGPRWNCVRAVKTRMSEVFAELRLPAEYETELGERPLHPALLDMAATIGLHLISRARRERYLFVPETVESVVIRAPLTSPCFAYAVQTGGDNAARGCFDVTIGLPDKPASVVIRGLRMRGLDRNAGQAFEFAGIGTGSAPTASPLGKILSLGLRAGEAGEIFERAFAAETRNVVVSPVRLSDLERVYEAMSTGPAAASAGTEMQVGRRRATGTQTTPADPTEAFVTGLFKELLGLEDVPPDASFLDLGGHSLAAVRMFARIRKKTGVDLPVSTLLEAPGVRALAALIREKDGTPEGPEETVVTVASTLEAAAARPTALEPSGEQSLRAAKEAGTGWSPTAVKPVSRMKAVDRGGTGHRPLVKIASGPDGRVPVFWVHGADGNVISGKPMSDHLTQPRTIWGLQAQGVDGRLPPLEKIEDMASRYLDAVMQVQRDGPICLVGFSGGGVIAYEMAQQLTATGTRPELLAMIDTLAPESSGRASLFDYLAYGRFLGLKRSWSLVRSGWRSHFSAYANPWKRDIINEFEIDDPLIDNTEKVFAAYLRAQSRYATLPYDGPVVLFRAGQPGLRFHAAGEHLGWGAHVRGGIRIHTVAADHDNIVKEPAVRDLARVLEAEMLTIDRLAATSGKPVASMLNIR